jgi:hypothetical protein
MIFKAGKYPQGDFNKERVQRMVDAYDPERGLEATVVIGQWYGGACRTQSREARNELLGGLGGLILRRATFAADIADGLKRRFSI